MGADPEKVVSRDSPANPEALDWFVGASPARGEAGAPDVLRRSAAAGPVRFS